MIKVKLKLSFCATRIISLIVTITIIKFWLVSALTLDGGKIQWIPATNFDPNEFDPAGYSDHGGDHKWLRYVGRTKYNNVLLVGQFSQGMEKMYTAYQGTEIVQEPEDAELLYAPPETLSWVPVTRLSFRIIHNMIEGGVMPETGESLYVCRTVVKEEDPTGDRFMVAIGYFRFETRNCTVSNNGKEFHEHVYELLIVNSYGILKRVDHST